jgi:hypothetical protein
VPIARLDQTLHFIWVQSLGDFLEMKKIIFCQLKEIKFYKKNSHSYLPIGNKVWDSKICSKILEEHKGGQLHEPKALQL